MFAFFLVQFLCCLNVFCGRVASLRCFVLEDASFLFLLQFPFCCFIPNSLFVSLTPHFSRGFPNFNIFRMLNVSLETTLKHQKNNVL